MRTARIPLSLCGLALAGAAALAGPKEDTARAEQAFRSGDLITAMTLLRKAADEGHAPAQARLADLLDAAEQDGEAVALYRKAAEQGEPAGQFGYGRMLARGEGVTRDVTQGLQWMRRAADAGHLPALEALARAYRSGDLGLARDPAEAERLDAEAKALRAQRGGGEMKPRATGLRLRFPTAGMPWRAAMRLLPLAALAVLCAAASAASPDRGQDLYAKHCAHCHGQNGRAVWPGTPDFKRTPVLLRPDAQLIASIRRGKGVMPAYEGLLRERELLDLVAYLRTMY